MNEFKLKQIGTIATSDGRSTITLDEPFRAGLQALAGFGYVNVLYWCHGMDNPGYRQYVSFPKCYSKGPDPIGVFATRSPVRPNPIALTACPVLSVDEGAGTLEVTGLDAEDGSPLLDIKPYLPSEDRVKDAVVPDWCSHWPSNVEESEGFDWGAEMIIPGQ